MTYANENNYRQPRPRKIELDGRAIHAPTDAQLLAAGWLPEEFAPLAESQQHGAPIVEAERVYYPAEYLPIGQIAAIKRAEITAAQDALVDSVIGCERDKIDAIALGLGITDRRLNGIQPTPEEGLLSDTLRGAEAFSRHAQERERQLLEAIDAAEAAGDVPALLEIRWSL